MQGTSRGGADLKEIVRRIDLWGLTHLYVVGGNGGNAAANAINTELQAAGVVCSVIGVPKSIDNDILLVRTYSPGQHAVGSSHTLGCCLFPLPQLPDSGACKLASAAAWVLLQRMFAQ